MACVELEGFLDFGGYLITISIDKREGGWRCWAQFEEVVEYDGSLQIPVYRHRVPGAFKTRDGSIDAGIAYARQTVEAGKVVIRPHTRQQLVYPRRRRATMRRDSSDSLYRSSKSLKKFLRQN